MYRGQNHTEFLGWHHAVLMFKTTERRFHRLVVVEKSDESVFAHRSSILDRATVSLYRSWRVPVVFRSAEAIGHGLLVMPDSPIAIWTVQISFKIIEISLSSIHEK